MQARRAARKSIEAENWKPAYTGQMQENLARVETQLGDKDATIKLIAALLRKPYMSPLGIAATPLTPALLQLDPAWEPLRKDPCFKTLLKEHKP